MSVTSDELMYLQSQLEGLESIFLELMPFGVELKRQQVQDYYDKRFDQAVRPTPAVAENELRRQFNTKANQVRNLVDSAESLGEAGNKFNLVRAAATLPDERSIELDPGIITFCQKLLAENKCDYALIEEILTRSTLAPVEARIILGSVMFLIVEEVDQDGSFLRVSEILSRMLQRVNQLDLLGKRDPFMVEAQCALEAMKEDEA